MSQLLRPAIALMNRLRYPQKFLLISLLFILPLALVMTLLIAEVNTKADFAQKAQVAKSLLVAAQAVRLLGARIVLTGIRPEVAQTLVGLGVDLGDIVTRSTLQSGIAYATKEKPVSSRQ